MQTNSYNGWTNYETWLLNLWQDNEQSEQQLWPTQARECIAVDGDLAVQSLSDIMREHYELRAEQLVGVTGFWQDLIGAALSEVNWREIAEHRIDESRNQVAA